MATAQFDSSFRQQRPDPGFGSQRLLQRLTSANLPVRRVKALFVSDVHLGSRFSRAEEFLHMLMTHQPDDLYLVGDLLDGWKLKKQWFWNSVYDDILNRLAELQLMGTQITYLPGNHDAFLRSYIGKTLPWKMPFELELVNETIHKAIDGREFLVTHGDQFDHHECASGWVSACVTVAYDWVLAIDTFCARWQKNSTKREIAARLKGLVGSFGQFFEEYRGKCRDYARRQGLDGIICGHIHQPIIENESSIAYLNTGDWVEHCTALIEDYSGQWQLCELKSNQMTPIAEFHSTFTEAPENSVVLPSNDHSDQLSQPAFGDITSV